MNNRYNSDQENCQPEATIFASTIQISLATTKDNVNTEGDVDDFLFTGVPLLLL